MPIEKAWDYLIVTAANDQQALSYEFEIRQRQQSGSLGQIRNCLVVPDIDGKRIGSGGSTLHSLLQILQRECSGHGPTSFVEAAAALSKLRVLIVHAGGDSRRLPAYSHCGKMFVPLPGPDPAQPASTLFDRLIPIFLNLPDRPGGQIVVASGDALILFDPSNLDLSRPGITALGLRAPAKESAHHGVFCAKPDGAVSRFLQKPSPEEQSQAGALDAAGESVLDLGVMSFDAQTAIHMMRAFLAESDGEDVEPGLVWKENSHDALLTHGIDLYREICCAMGTETSPDEYRRNLNPSGSPAGMAVARDWFESLHEIPLHVCVLPHAKFLHFGTTRQLITSGLALIEQDGGDSSGTLLVLNTEGRHNSTGDFSWVEGCSIEAPLVLEGFNVVVGARISEPLSLRKGACFDIAGGSSRSGENVWFLRFYGVDDSFKHSEEAGGTFCGIPIRRWIEIMGGRGSDVWAADVPAAERTLWNARVFPALGQHHQFCEWMWLFHPESASAEQKKRFWSADRYSSSEIAVRVDQARFYAQRRSIR